METLGYQNVILTTTRFQNNMSTACNDYIKFQSDIQS